MVSGRFLTVVRFMLRKFIVVSAVFTVVFSGAQQLLYSSKEPVTDVLLDDFYNTYVFRDADFTLSKYTPRGNLVSSLRLTQPFKIQSVENPLNIFLFSENVQELRILDANLNEIQRLPFYEHFEHIKAAYVEDLQYVWLLDDSRKTIIQYQFRDGKVISSFPLKMDMDGILDFLVYQNRIYILKTNAFHVFTLSGKEIWSTEILDGRKLRREKDGIYVVSTKSIAQYTPENKLKTVFSAQNFSIVEKNSGHYLAWMDDKFYLYPLEK